MSSDKLKCLYCERGFWKMDDLQKHVRACTEKRHTCKKCSATFTREFDLERHSKTKHGYDFGDDPEISLIDPAPKRKATSPMPVVTGKKQKEMTVCKVNVTPTTATITSAPKQETKTVTGIKGNIQKKEMSVQTEKVQMEHKRTVKVTRTFKDGDADIVREVVHETRWVE